MALEKNKLLVRRYIEEIINTGSTTHIAKFISPDYVEVFEGKRHSVGLEGAKQHIIGVRTTYPDLKVMIDLQIAEGDYVATCITATGTHKGCWMNIKPTNKLVKFSGVNIDKIVNGLIVEHGGSVDIFGPYLEIGAIKLVTLKKEKATK